MQLNDGPVVPVCLPADCTIMQAAETSNLPLMGCLFLYKNQILIGTTQIESLQTSQCDLLRVITEIKLWIQLNDEITATEYTLRPASTLSFLSLHIGTILVTVNNKVLDSTLTVYHKLILCM